LEFLLTTTEYNETVRRIVPHYVAVIFSEMDATQ